MDKFTRKQMDRILDSIDIPDGYEKNDFYGSSYYKRKKDNVHVIAIVYDYKSNMVRSSQMEIIVFEDAMKIIRCIEQFAEDKTAKNVISENFFCDDEDENETEEEK